MGCGFELICLDCKERIYLGYGSYTSWLTFHSVKEYDDFEDLDGHKALSKNKAVRAALVEHDGHAIHFASEDWTSHDGKDLMMLGPYGAESSFVPGYADFTYKDYS